MADDLEPNAALAAVEAEPETPAQAQMAEAKPATLSIDDALAALTSLYVKNAAS